jgi:integrase
MKVISTQQLDNVLLEQLDNLKNNYDFKGYNTFKLLYDTGIRAGEVNLKYWKKITTDLYELTPTKRNNPRFFTKELPKEWKDAIQNNSPIAFLNSYSNQMRMFQRHKVWNRITVDKKEICMHLYRHLFARKLKEAGQTDEQIRVAMGEKKQSSADQYIYGILYVD